jgi:hypothetical protein
VVRTSACGGRSSKSDSVGVGCFSATTIRCVIVYWSLTSEKSAKEFSLFAGARIDFDSSLRISLYVATGVSGWRRRFCKAVGLFEKTERRTM